MEWLKKRLRRYISIEDYVSKEIEKQCKVLAKAVERGSYPWDDESRSIARALNELIKRHAKKLSDREVAAQVNKIVEELALNKEKFLDDIVTRLKAKQV